MNLRESVERTLIVIVGLALVAVTAILWRENQVLKRQVAFLESQVLAPAEPESVSNQDHESTTRLATQNARLSNEVRQLQAALARSRRTDQALTASMAAVASVATASPAEQLTMAALQGDLGALDRLAQMAAAAVTNNHPNMTLEEQQTLSEQLRPIRAAFDTLTQEASQGNENALRALTQAARRPSLSGLALTSLGELAARGSEGALNVVLDPQKFEIDVPLASTVAALRPAAESGNPRAIAALASLAEDDSKEPLWRMAANGLGKAAGSGDPVAIDALIAFGRSTNVNVRSAVRAGLNAAAASQDPKAIEALRAMKW